MSSARPRRIRYADVAATLALALAVSTGGAYAAGQIGSGDIAKNAVKSKHIAKGAVKAADLKNNAVTGAKVKDGSLNGADLADGGVGGADLATRVPGVALAGVTVDSNGSVVRSFNRLGAKATGTRPATGQYQVTIPGASFNGFQSALASVNGSTGAYCYINNGTGSTLNVNCRDFDGVATNTTINLVLFSDAAGTAAPRSHKTADGTR